MLLSQSAGKNILKSALYQINHSRSSRLTTKPKPLYKSNGAEGF